MTCERMREALLQAEVAELRGEGASTVAVHVRECAACRRDAARILAATTQLGGVVRRRRGRRWVIALPLAAAAALVLWLRPFPAPVVAPTSPLAPAAQAADPGVEVAPTRPLLPRASAARIPVHASRLEASTPTVAVAFTPVAQAATPLEASVPVPSRKHPTVLRTSDPAITVLWFE